MWIEQSYLQDEILRVQTGDIFIEKYKTLALIIFLFIFISVLNNCNFWVFGKMPENDGVIAQALNS